MNSKYIIGNGVVADGTNIFLENGAIEIEDGLITNIGKTRDIKIESEKFIDVKGKVIIPGLLNPHNHLYSYFSPGIVPKGETNNFKQILENLWWKLDCALDKESVYYSALMGITNAIRHGVTMIFDHHASMKFVEGSLIEIEKAFNKCGIKGLLCFESSARHGNDEFEKHIDENISFFKRKNENVKGVMGLHANLTLSNSNLNFIAKNKPKDMPIHIHLGEDISDLLVSTQAGYKGPAHRLHSYGLLDNKSILAHAIHLKDEDFAAINHHGSIVVSNPESNANNRVGKMSRKYFTNYILGTDGMTNDIIKTLNSHYLLGDGNKEDFKKLSKAFFEYKFNVQEKYFDKTGSFKPGKKADISVLNYTPLSPINNDNLLGHLIFGAQAGEVYMTISDGKILFKDGKINYMNEDEEILNAKEVAKRLHYKYYS